MPIHRLASVLLCCALLIATGAMILNAADKTAPSPFHYPEARKSDQVDDYHGTKVADPYRWMENLDSPEVKSWVDAENKLTFSYLETIPQRAAIKARLTKLWNYERYSAPYKRGTRYFYAKNNGLQNQPVEYWQESLTGEPHVLIDPNTLSPDGTVALSGIAYTQDGRLMAYGISASGSDWQEWHIRDVSTGKDLPDDLKWVKFSSASFTKDGKGLFYSRYDEPSQASMMQAANYFQKLYFHKVGTPQSEDVLIFERPDMKELGFSGNVTDDGHYVIVTVWQGSDRKNRVYYKDLSDPKSQVIRLLDNFDAGYQFIDNDGPVFWFKTDLDSPRGRIIAIDTRHPERMNWKVIVPETKDAIDFVSVIDDKFVVGYLKDAQTEVRVFDLAGKFIRNVDLPAIGTAEGFTGMRTDKETFYAFTSFTTPTTIYRYDVANGKSTVFRQPKVDFNPAGYETHEVFYNSKDGTRVPMFITYKKGTKQDGQNPTYLFGYGGFNQAVVPVFSVSNLVWMEMGGIYAQASLRGGSEYGEDWHQAGTKLQKQNVFDDFIAAAEYLIANNYTSTPKLAIGGGSNGGLLVGACLTQRPDLYGAALPAVGVMDMLRFQKFTIGWAWVSDYGSSDDPEQFKAIYKYSPLNNLKPGTSYPPTLITTADHDDRVVPSHSFKFAAAIQADQAGPAPVMIRIETKAGHGAGKPITKTIEEVTDKWSFLVKSLNMTPKM